VRSEAGRRDRCAIRRVSGSSITRRRHRIPQLYNGRRLAVERPSRPRAQESRSRARRSPQACGSAHCERRGWVGLTSLRRRASARADDGSVATACSCARSSENSPARCCWVIFPPPRVIPHRGSVSAPPAITARPNRAAIDHSLDERLDRRLLFRRKLARTSPRACFSLCTWVADVVDDLRIRERGHVADVGKVEMLAITSRMILPSESSACRGRSTRSSSCDGPICVSIALNHLVRDLLAGGEPGFRASTSRPPARGGRRSPDRSGLATSST